MRGNKCAEKCSRDRVKSILGVREDGRAIAQRAALEVWLEVGGKTGLVGKRVGGVESRYASADCVAGVARRELSRRDDRLTGSGKSLRVWSNRMALVTSA